MKTIATALLNALKPTPLQPYHFHAGEGGRAYVCEDPHCTSPGYDPAQLD
jgi:hypothetical protein